NGISDCIGDITVVNIICQGNWNSILICQKDMCDTISFLNWSGQNVVISPSSLSCDQEIEFFCCSCDEDIDFCEFVANYRVRSEISNSTGNLDQFIVYENNLWTVMNFDGSEFQI